MTFVDTIATGRSQADWLAAAKKHSLVGRMDKSHTHGPVLHSGLGSVVRDVEGKEYLDFNSGQMCSALGHCHPKIVEAIRRAADTLIHASSMFFNTAEIRLAERLAELLPPGVERSLFLESGADANESALGMAKRVKSAYEVASPHVSFHGLTDTTRSVTFAGWRKGYGPFAPGAYAILAPYEYRCPFRPPEEETCGLRCLDASFEMLDAQLDGQLAAVITEPLFSAGGVIEPPAGWLAALHRKTRERNALLIFDEAQTGLAKLGTMWGADDSGVVPDLMTISKHFGGGISISAVAATADVADAVQRSEFVTGHSHQNDPLACTAALASLDVIVEEGLVDKATELGSYWHHHLEELKAAHVVIGDVRGRGLLHGIELVTDRTSKEPACEIGQSVESLCIEAGLLLSARRNGSVLRFVPPWSTTPEQMDRAAEILDQALSTAVALSS